MDDRVSLLITLFYDETILRCAIKIDGDALEDDVLSFPMEPDNKMKIAALLPIHVRSCGPIIDVEQIFDVCIL